jgi:hypothetical protein
MHTTFLFKTNGGHGGQEGDGGGAKRETAKEQMDKEK